MTTEKQREVLERALARRKRRKRLLLALCIVLLAVAAFLLVAFFRGEPKIPKPYDALAAVGAVVAAWVGVVCIGVVCRVKEYSPPLQADSTGSTRFSRDTMPATKQNLEGVGHMLDLRTAALILGGVALTANLLFPPWESYNVNPYNGTHYETRTAGRAFIATPPKPTGSNYPSVGIDWPAFALTTAAMATGTAVLFGIASLLRPRKPSI